MSTKRWMAQHARILLIAAWIGSSIFCYGSLNALAHAEPAPCRKADSRQQMALLIFISMIPAGNVIAALGPTGFVEHGLDYRPVQCVP
jgi:hypothetical protein